MDLHQRYPGLEDLKRRAKRRLPRFVWDYLDSGTGAEAARARNRTGLDRVGFMPSVLHGPMEPDLSTPFLGSAYALPFGIAPVGMSGLIWPDAEGILARSAAAAGIPYCLSTVASQSPEDLAPHLAGDGWFQLYPPKDEAIRSDLLARARDAGFKTLVLTVDVPAASRRERQTRSGLTQPPKLTPRLMAQIARRPAWALGMARRRLEGRGMPRMRTLDKYISAPQANLPPTAHIGYLLRTSPDWDYVHWLRRNWDGPFVIKGVLRAEDAVRLQEAGADAVWISNHGGRQFDGCPAAIDLLPEIRAAVELPLIFDSGIEGGLDILRALALGADFIMLGRAFHYALAALGAVGPAHLIDMLAKDMQANMSQLGLPGLGEIRNLQQRELD
ncbi:alpha-hydroxy-acid oxidizing protein [Leisingera sp. M527]|uniref:alpha-hydroxy acid oxidase n=1 Tax=Leisingera sp. M527 TaxID=2867014 RepID=UPI0021A7487E|nr:alpha-hydroxy acid oxidase [Leisingera sp. M527]UWQ31581.1 alpha-hydroxy-acid oxidizing protein [Leisingera sp. M527]